jgi:hypothetical protein
MALERSALSGERTHSDIDALGGRDGGHVAEDIRSMPHECSAATTQCHKNKLN